MWQYLEELNAAKYGTISIDIKHQLPCTEQVILLRGKTLNTWYTIKDVILYRRLCYILSVRQI